MDPTIVFNGPTYPVWDWRVALDLFFGGIGVGAFLIAVLVDWRYAGKYRRICHTAAVAAPVFVTLGLLFLMLKMGRPMALFYTFTTVAPTSPLWWGGIFQTLFILGAIYYALQWQMSDANVAFRRKLGWWLLPLAVIVGAYHGFLLSVLRARPLWNTGPTVVAAVLGFLTTGMAAVLLIHLLRMKLAHRLEQKDWVSEFLTDIREMRLLLGAALLAQLFTFFIWWISLLFGPQGAQDALAAANAAYGSLFWGIGIGAGLVLPLLIGGYAVLRGERLSVSMEVNTIWVTSALILVGGIVYRMAVVLGGQAAPFVNILS
jgi:protein NrfD